MVKANELVVKGTASQYLTETPTIFCYKKNTNGSTCIPCRFHTKEKTYDSIIFNVPDITLRPEQEKVLEEMENQSDDNKICNTIFGNIYTGFGKSAIGSIFAARKQGPILIFCNTDAIRKGWIGTWKDFFGIDIHCASGKVLGKHKVCICSTQLAVQHIKEYASDLKYYKTVICDEADTLCTQSIVNVLLELTPKYLIGLTATVRRNDGLDGVLDIFWGSRTNWIKRLKEFSESCSMILNILYTPFKIDSIFNKKNALDWMAMAQVSSSIEDRNILIRNLCVMHMNKKILILTKIKDHVEILYNKLSSINIDVSTYCGTAKAYYDAHVLIATLSKAGRGYDDKQVSAAFDGRRFDILILCITMRDADQALGRALRGDNLGVYLIVDDNTTMKNHAEEMKKVNSRRGATIVEEYM